MKAITLRVTLKFNGNMPAKLVKQLVANVAANLRADADTSGLVPDDCETFTTRITVRYGKNKAVENIC